MPCALSEGDNCKFDEFKKQIHLARIAKYLGYASLIQEMEQPIKTRLKLEYLTYHDLIMLEKYVNSETPTRRLDNGTCQDAQNATGQTECKAYIKD